MKPRYFQQGFAFLPVVILVALVGLMVPTVKYVTDSDISFDNRGFARIAEKAGFDDQTIGKIKDQVTNSNKGVSKEEVEKDFSEVLKERREERRAEQAAGEVSNQQLQAVVNRLDPEAQQSIIDELATPTPKPTLVPTPSPDIGDVDNELFGLLDQEAQDSIVKELEEEKKAAAEAAAAVATNKLNESGYLPEDDKVQIEDENTDKEAEAAADRWAGYADNQIVGQEAYDRAEEEKQRRIERNRIQQHLDQAQTQPDPSPVVYTYDTTSPDLTPEGKETLTDLNQVDCSTLTSQARSACLAAVENEMRTSEDALIAFGQGLNTITFGAFGNYLETQVEKNQEYGYGSENYNYWERATDLESVGSAAVTGTIIASEIVLAGIGIHALSTGGLGALAASESFAVAQTGFSVITNTYEASQTCDKNNSNYSTDECIEAGVSIALAGIDQFVPPAIRNYANRKYIPPGYSKVISSGFSHLNATASKLSNSFYYLESAGDVYESIDACRDLDNKDECKREIANLAIQGIITVGRGR